MPYVATGEVLLPTYPTDVLNPFADEQLLDGDDQVAAAVLDLALRSSAEPAAEAAATTTVEQSPEIRSLEDGHNDNWVYKEVYSHSIRLLKIVGRLKLEGKLDTPEGQAELAKLYERFMSSIAEMVHTSPGFREKLEINRVRDYPIVDGYVTDLDRKTKLVSIAARGYMSALAEATTKPYMVPIAQHNGADVRVGHRGNALSVGEGFYGLSADLQEGMQAYGQDLYDELGWRLGLVFLQGQSKLDEYTMRTYAYSVDHSDLPIWKEVLAEFGIVIPGGEPSATWLDHSGALTGDPLQDDKLLRRVRARFYEKKGITTKFYCVDTFVADNEDVCKAIFQELYIDLAVCSVTSELSDTLRIFVDNILLGAEHLDTDIHAQLVAIRKRDVLTDVDIQLLEQLVRYAVPERLRPALALLGKEEHPRVVMFVATDAVPYAHYVAKASAGGVINGARDNRTYGGCTRAINLGRRKKQGKADDSQEEDNTEWRGESAEEGEEAGIPDEIRCIKCKKNSPKEQVIHVNKKTGQGFWECPHCRYWKDVCTGAEGYRNGRGGERITLEEVWRRLVGATKAIELPITKK